MTQTRRRQANGRPPTRRHLRLVPRDGAEGWLAAVQIRGRARIPVGQQLEAHLARAIGEGRIAPGSPLPSTRRLAGRFPIHRNTVAAMYRRLARRGFVTVQQGRVARVVSVPGLGADDGSADSARVRPITGSPTRGTVRVAVVATGFDHRWAVVGDLVHQLCGDVEILSISPRAALARPDLFAGRIAVVELPLLGAVLPKLRQNVPVAVLRYAPVAPLLEAAKRRPDPGNLTTVLTGCPRLRTEFRALATGLDGPVFIPAPGSSLQALRYTVRDRPVWTDWMREEEARAATGGVEGRIRRFIHTGPSTVRLLQRWILAGRSP